MHAPTSAEAGSENRFRNDITPRAASGDLTDIAREARHRLRTSAYLALQDVSPDVDGETIQLSGRLPTQYLKQIAQACVAEIPGVGRVVNLIKVAASSSRDGRATGPSSHRDWSR